MKKKYRLRASLAALGAALLSTATSSAQVIFSESFESPAVGGFSSNTAPNTGWIGATNGFGASNRGLFNEAVAWPATPEFSTPYGDQAYLLNYSNSGLTSAQGTIPGTLTQDVTYMLSFNAAVEQGTASGSYVVEFVAFDPADDDTARRNAQSTRPGNILATATGSVTTTDMSESGSLVFTPEAGNSNIGKEMGIRLIKGSNSVLYDNIRLIVGHDLAPNPADGVTIQGGSVTLNWTNWPPNVGTDVFVDVWFGTDPGSLTKIVDGGMNISSTSINAPVADTYYWRVDSYLEGSVAGSPINGSLLTFYVTDTDGDGFPDTYELANTDPPSSTALNPGDDLENGGTGDGLTNLQEYQFGTDPNDPDSDDDNLEDGEEIAGAGLRPATNPLDSDSDDDGLQDDVETNKGSWTSSSDTGTNPIDPDYDKDGLKDGAETNTDAFVSATNTGTDPFDPDSDNDGAFDWYEVASTFTSPLNPLEKPDVPYPLPDPDGATGTTDKPVKVYIMSGQSNTVGIGYINDSDPGSLATIAKREHKFPNLVDSSNDWTERQDVWYEGVVTATAKKWLTAGCGATNDRIGPELGFGHILGHHHDEPVIIIKASQGNRSLGWDFLPPGSAQYEFGANTYAGYSESPLKWATGTEPEPIGWYAGKQYDDCFNDTHDVLDNFATKFPQYAAQGYEIAGFTWWQGHKDQYDAGHYERYEQNLIQLIDSLRTEFNAPNAPFVVASIGFDGGQYDPNTPYGKIYAAQMAVGDPAENPQFAGTVKSVDTTKYWRETSESPGNQGFHYNNSAETYMLVGDAMGRAMLSLLEDISPPLPDPMAFEIAPSAVDTTTVGMQAVTAADISGPVEYYFENTTNSDFRDWDVSPSWSNTSLSSEAYNYRVKARDARGNETEWSAILSASPGDDVTPPSPDPMAFTSLPTELGQSSIAMTATTASDINDVEYYFNCTTPGGNDSGWQDSPEYTDTGLAPGTQFTYRVQARDKSTGQNITAFSSAASATTTAPDLTAPQIDSFDPVDDSIEIPVETAMSVTFDENITAGTGFVTIKNITDSTQSSIDIADGTQVSITDATLTITPAGNLVQEKDYAIHIDATAIEDLAGNAFAGIDSDTMWNFTTVTPPPVGLLLSEDFESPDVPDSAGDGNTNKSIPNNGNWIGSSQGFGADRRGITDKAGGDFSAADPNMQAFAFRYTNSGLTSSEGAMGVLAANVTYTVSFDVVRDDGRNAGLPYSAQLIAFAPGAARNDCRSTPSGSTVIATKSGNAPSDGSLSTVTFDHTPEAGDSSLGLDLGIRFIGATSSAIIDNVQVTSSGGGGDNGFDDWIAGFPAAGSLSGFLDDADSDGIANGLENYFGTSPIESSTGLVAGTVSGNMFTFAHRISDSPADDISATYQWSTDLENFNDDGVSNAGTTINFSQGTITDGMVVVTATIAGTIPSNVFVNLSLTQQP